MVIEEHARLEILLPNEENWRHISENDIIQNSLSIAEINYDEVELNTLEIADFTLNFSRVYCKFYDGYPYERGNSNGGITVDISENPFKAG